MALSNQFSNEISRIMQYAEQLLALRQELQLLRTRWDQNDMYNLLLDADIQAVDALGNPKYPSLQHLTKSEISNAVAAFDAVLTALGDNVTGQAVNLIKLKG